MKILILAHHAGDVFRLRKELIGELLNKGFEVFFCAPSYDNKQEIVNFGCRFIELNFKRNGINFIKDLKLIFDYYKIMSNIKPNVVLSYAIKPNIYGGIAARIKNISQIANITGLGTVFEKDSIIQKLVVWLYRIAFKKTKCVFVQNIGNLEVLKKHRISTVQKIRLIPGSGVNLLENDLKEYILKDKINFLFIARVTKLKGIEEFLEMAKFIRQKHSNTEFTILGKIETEEYKIKLDEYKDIVKYEGFQKDVRKYIIDSNCIVLPSYTEGLANVLLEAAATGRPIIATNINGCKETIDDGINGFICEAKNVQSLIDAVEKFLNLSYEEQRAMGIKGRRKMEMEFDRKIVVNAYMEEINS